MFFHLRWSESWKIEWNRIKKKSASEMYGNYYDYGDPGLGNLRKTTKNIMTDTRDAVSSISSAGTDVYDKVTAGMSDQLEDVGVGNVSDFLDTAYTPYLNDTTTDYATFMADTPQRIQDNIAATQVAYNAGQADRMRDFQDLLKEVKAFTYSADNYEPATDPGPGAEAPVAEAPAEPELKALMPKFKNANDKKTASSLEEYRNLYGNKFSMSDYNDLIAQGINPDKIEKNLMAYNAAGGKIGNSVFTQMGYDVVKPQDSQGMGPYISNSQGNLIVPQETDNAFDLFQGQTGNPFIDSRPAERGGAIPSSPSLPGIPTFQKGSGFGEADRERALDAGYTDVEVDDYLEGSGRNPIDYFQQGPGFGNKDKQRAIDAGWTNEEINKWMKANGWK